MSYREVHVVEVREVVRLWSRGESLRAISRLTGLDRKTVRRYVKAARQAGCEVGEPAGDAVVGEVIGRVRAQGPGVRGSSWAVCTEHRELLAGWLDKQVPLSKVQELLGRHTGVVVPYRTLHRYAARELGFGGRRVTVRVAEGKPGEELQLDFGAASWIREGGRRRRVWALVFTAIVSRHMFVWLTYRQSVADVVAGCEAAWVFFGGVFRVLIPDNLKAIVTTADRDTPRLNAAFVEYAQARGFVVDPARVRHPQDKGRVERTVHYVQTSLFAGEAFSTLAEAQVAAERWCGVTAGGRIHGTTRQRPAEHFAREERPLLLPAPEVSYEVAPWSEVRVQRDHHLSVAKALYSVPTEYIGERVQVRNGRDLVRIYHRGKLIKVHPRVGPGQRSTDGADYPPGVRELACRDQQALLAQARDAGAAIGVYAERLLAAPQPWTRMRHVYRLLGLVRRYAVPAVEQACARALEADVVDVTRVARMVEQAVEQSPLPARPQPGEAAPGELRFLRQASEYRLARGGDHE
ncbi:MAG TPA: IS21 family transposase [Thermoanaerobaculia bacterium]|nr:IS21 family transposase [Thermoanaerobaculia bacterium]